MKFWQEEVSGGGCKRDYGPGQYLSLVKSDRLKSLLYDNLSNALLSCYVDVDVVVNVAINIPICLFPCEAQEGDWPRVAPSREVGDDYVSSLSPGGQFR